MKFENICVSYWERTILHNININIEPWEFVFLIGSSWSGKTSFIKTIFGEKKLKSWKILDDKWQNITKLKPKELLEYRRNLGIIFQDFKLLPRKTVRENVAFAMEVCWYSQKEIHKRIPEVLTQVGLLAKKEKFVETLSGWEIQRTCIARALIHHPNIIIWDEPTWNLDKHNALEVMHLLEKLNKQWKTVIVATHDENIVNSMKKRVIAFKDWKIFSDKKEWNYCL